MPDTPPATALRRDYDPMQVMLPIFDGPLDLLLHLVRQRRLDINALRLSELTEPYLAYVQQIQELDLDRAGEFLAIAAQLIWIKSRELLPKELAAEEEQDPETLEELLLLRLQQYQQIKEATGEMERRHQLGRDVFARQAPPDDLSQAAEEAPLFEEVSIYGLIEAFGDVLKRSEQAEGLHVIPDESRIEDRLHQLVQRLATLRSVYFHDLFPLNAARDEVILTFIAILELVRMRAIRVVQTRHPGDIYCQVTETFEAEDADWEHRVMQALLGRVPEGPPTPVDGPAESQDNRG